VNISKIAAFTGGSFAFHAAILININKWILLNSK